MWPFKPNIPALVRKRKVALLILYCQDRRLAVRKEALEAIAQLNTAGGVPALDEAIQRLVESTSPQRCEERLVEIADTLGPLAAPALVRALERLLAKPIDQRVTERIAVERAMHPSAYGDDTKQRRTALEREERTLRVALIRAIVRSGDSSCVLTLLKDDVGRLLRELQGYEMARHRRANDALELIRKGQSAGEIADSLLGLLHTSPWDFPDGLVSQLTEVKDEGAEVGFQPVQFGDPDIKALGYRVGLSRLRSKAESERLQRHLSRTDSA